MTRTPSVAIVVAFVVAVAWSASAQAPTVLNAAVGSNMNHVPSFVRRREGHLPEARHRREAEAPQPPAGDVEGAPGG
jgi:hypothetical protein